MKRIVFFTYGVFGHLMFLAVYAYLAGFVGSFMGIVPKSIDYPVNPDVPLAMAIAINLSLIILFGAQHSIMARPAFKAVWTRWVPRPIERSTYVHASNMVTILLMWLWQPIDVVVWNVTWQPARIALMVLFAAGWLLVPLVSLMINHFDLFGTRQVWLYFRGREYSSLPFRTPMLYLYVRHPLYIGWALAFWATPTMTLGHLLFASAMTGYMALAAQVEERDLVQHFGQEYETYRKQVPQFVPRLG